MGGSLALAAERGLTVPAAMSAERMRELLAHPLTAANAVTLALVNNPDTRVMAAELGLAAADVYDAGRLSNPVLGLSRLTTNDPAAVAAETSLSIAVQFTDLLFLRSRSATAAAHMESKQHEVARAMQALAAQTEKAWLAVVAAEQRLAIQRQIAQAAQASADLAQRYFDAGNIPRRALALEQATAVEAHLAVSSAEAAVATVRARLSRAMGLPMADAWTVEAGLALPGDDAPPIERLRAEARQQRLDLIAAERDAEAIATAFRLTRNTQLLGDATLGFEVTRETDNTRTRGPSVSLALPLFNWGSGRRARAESQLQAAEGRLTGLMLDAEGEIETAYAQLMAARAQALRYRSELIPLTETVVDQMQREQNFMLIGVFELITARREGYEVYGRYIDTLLAYWQARTDLGLAVGRSLGLPPPATPSPAPEQAVDDADAHQHHHHHGDH